MSGEARAVVEVLGEPLGAFESVKVSCTACSYIVFTSRMVGNDRPCIASHLAQHEPGRAFDIEPEWVLRADCSVCEGGGDVIVDPDGDGDMVCTSCRTRWDRNGEGGERAERDDEQEGSGDDQ